ncbi:S8 family serine peptidase [Alkalibacillus aidingensis]|uniref:S8 family serine peptidase n=1 Tax=Alkalibacillus aidingensis TaxID=2747607 RepID=UPI001661539D|nr:S8 family serine peptidase [Alkalibacillus aidingensis]
MRLFASMFVITLFLIIQPLSVHGDDNVWIIETTEDPHEVKQQIERDYPFVEVLYTYDTLLQALAIKGDERHVEELHQEEWVESYHPTQTYEAPTVEQSDSSHRSLPDNRITNTSYTGKGIKVGVIDTGIDYSHPDLANNFKGGFDLVDFDEDPMETTKEQGLPTEHGTHVAGIIAANGQMRGVAPDADIHAYRALGPGGTGSSAQILAALEKAVKDGMDIINLSLGVDVNSPDYPMAEAVNQAFDLGVSVVVANGNSGPNDWTVSSPATAEKAISVGAGYTEIEFPEIAIHQQDPIPVRQIPYSEPWSFKKAYPLEHVENIDGLTPTIQDRILVIDKQSLTYPEIISAVTENGAKGVIIYSDENDDPNEWQWVLTKIPVIYMSEEEVEPLIQHHNWVETEYETDTDNMAEFSARGPVTSDWTIKPDITAPGVDVVSTIPGGYAALQGTSMASPYIAGVIALLKEKNPDASPQELKDQVLTAAEVFEEKPSAQGVGFIDTDQLFNQDYSITGKGLNFGKVGNHDQETKTSITVNNNENQPLTVRWNMPRKQTGLTWNLPLTTTIEPNSQKTFEIAINLQKNLLKSGVHEGYLTLQLNGENQNLPYLLINETADYPRVTGFEMEIPPFKQDQLNMKLYIAEELERLTVTLYDEQLIQQSTLIDEEQVSSGTFETTFSTAELERGNYQVVIEADDGNEIQTDTKEIMIP